MLCYDHIKAGTKQEAVAACAISGRGVCLEHSNEHEMQILRK